MLAAVAGLAALLAAIILGAGAVLPGLGPCGDLLRFVRPSSCTKLAVYEGQAVSALAVAPGETMIVALVGDSASSRTPIHLLEISPVDADLVSQTVLNEQSVGVRAIAVSPDGTKLAVSPRMRTIDIYDRKDYQLTATVEVLEPDYIGFDDMGRLLVAHRPRGGGLPDAEAISAFAVGSADPMPAGDFGNLLASGYGHVLNPDGVFAGHALNAAYPGAPVGVRIVPVDKLQSSGMFLPVEMQDDCTEPVVALAFSPSGTRFAASFYCNGRSRLQV